MVENLRRRGFIDQLSDADIRGSSAERLIGWVKTFMTGPQSWPSAKSRAPSQPQEKLPTRLLRQTVSRISRPPDPEASLVNPSLRVTIRPTEDRASRFPEWVNPTTLLPGGRYILFSGWNSVHCWTVDTNSWLWSHASAIGIRSFGVEVVKDGENAIIVICFKTQSHD